VQTNHVFNHEYTVQAIRSFRYVAVFVVYRNSVSGKMFSMSPSKNYKYRVTDILVSVKVPEKFFPHVIAILKLHDIEFEVMLNFIKYLMNPSLFIDILQV